MPLGRLRSQRVATTWKAISTEAKNRRETLRTEPLFPPDLATASCPQSSRQIRQSHESHIYRPSESRWHGKGRAPRSQRLKELNVGVGITARRRSVPKTLILRAQLLKAALLLEVHVPSLNLGQCFAMLVLLPLPYFKNLCRGPVKVGFCRAILGRARSMVNKGGHGSVSKLPPRT